MKRRDIIAMLGGAVLALPFDAAGQKSQGARRIGVLMSYPESDVEAQRWVAAFRTGLREAGWTEGGDLQYVNRWGANQAELMQQFAKELVDLKMDLILSGSTLTTTLLMRETATIPIIFTFAVDPIGSGLVTSIAQPGGNVTGFMNADPRMAGKWLELLKEIAPHVTRVAVPFNPDTETYAEVYLAQFRSAAVAAGMEVMAKPVHSGDELEALVAELAHQPQTGIVPMAGSFNTAHREEIIVAVNRYRVPAVYPDRPYSLSGGVLSYGIDNTDNFRRASEYANRILKGEKPGNLPVQFPEKFLLVINLKAARTLDIAISPTLLVQATEVIE